MKPPAVSENLLEFFALRMNLAPTRIIDTQMAFTRALHRRRVRRVGISSRRWHKARRGRELLHDATPGPTAQLLDRLVGLSYLKHAQGRYETRRS